MTISIIIAVKTWQRNLEECVGKCLELDSPDFEILILPDNALSNDLRDSRIKIIPTGAVSPPRKRDIAINYAHGEILAFIDDDAYPEKDWLKKAMENFINSEIAAVGGPAVTPKDDNSRQRASGFVYASSLVSAKFSYRYVSKKKMEVEDYPTCNFLVRKSIMQKLGGFNTDFWPGEDTKLCLDIAKKLNKKIIYDPQVLVYHHRRPLYLAHLRQIADYALHRGYFAKRYPQTSRKFSYFIPSLFLFTIFIGAISSIFFLPLRTIYFLGLSLYLLLVFVFSISKELRLVPLVFLGIILTHLTYGLWFLKGLFSQKLKEEK